MEFVESIRKAMLHLTEGEIVKLKIQATAWATVFYQAEVPDYVTRAIANLEVRSVCH